MTPNQVRMLAPAGNRLLCVCPEVLSVYELLQLLHIAWQTIPLSCCSVNVPLSGSMATFSTCCAHWPQVLNGVNLASFSLVDCAQTLLGQRLEVVPARCIAAWAGLATPMPK